MSTTDTSEALRILERIQQDAAQGQLRDASFSRACGLIGHLSNRVRWQALITVGEWIQSKPEDIWRLILVHGQSEDEDMRDGVATVLLEHLLEHHVDVFLPRLKKQIEGGAPLLADTLSRCWAFGEAEQRWGEVQELLARASSQPEKE